MKNQGKVFAYGNQKVEMKKKFILDQATNHKEEISKLMLFWNLQQMTLSELKRIIKKL